VDAAAQLEGKPSMMNQPSGSEGFTLSEALTKQQFKVSGNCEMCKERIETAAKSVSGVAFAEWNSETKLLHLNFDGGKTNIDNIQKTIAKAGHDTEKHKAPDNVYKALPECCLYR
jgi:Cu(I)/Ag(I) efflux system membrane fusion protein